MANPEMEYPTFNAWRDGQEVEEQAKAKYHSGLLPFEDRESVSNLLPAYAWQDAGFIDGLPHKLTPDTLIPVDLEVEVVEQFKWNDDVPPNEWIDCVIPREKHYRKVLRIL